MSPPTHRRTHRSKENRDAPNIFSGNGFHRHRDSAKLCAQLRAGRHRDDGHVLVQGELWRAQSDERLAPGERVRVDRLDGLTLDGHRIDT